MKHTRLTALLFLMLLGAALSPSAHARPTQKLPASVVLRDAYEGFTATLVSAGHGRFDVSIGESHEGDPGFEGVERGTPFDVSIAIYHMEPQRGALPYVPTYVPVAKGKQGMSVSPLFQGSKKVVFKGVAFYITPLKLSNEYGLGRSRIQVRAVEE